MSVDCVSQLGFHRPLTALVKEALVVRNPNNRPIAFKIKTTAPKQYCVRPNSGRIEPGQEVEVQVLLQAMKEEPPQDTKCRDKFLVQSTIISAENESLGITALWNAVESKNREGIHEKKIRCLFLPSGETGNTNSTSHHESYEGTSTPAYHAAEFSNAESQQPDTSIRSERETALPLKLEPVVQTMASEKKSDPLQAKLDDANEKIQQLQKQLASGGDRKRTEKVAHNEGVPVPITALIALIAFLAAYLLF